MPGPLTNSDKTYTMMSFFLMFLVNRPRLCLCMLKKAVVAYWFDISWPLKFSSKESDSSRTSEILQKHERNFISNLPRVLQ